MKDFLDDMLFLGAVCCVEPRNHANPGLSYGKSSIQSNFGDLVLQKMPPSPSTKVLLQEVGDFTRHPSLLDFIPKKKQETPLVLGEGTNSTQLRSFFIT